MESCNFMTFGLEEKVNCIQHFRESEIFVATPKQINIFDLVDQKLLAQCNHSIGKGQQEEALSALQMHYFPCSKENILGYLVVHYKLVGLSTYKVEQANRSQDHIFQPNNFQQSIGITFLFHLPVNFGSAFLKLAFLTDIYQEINAKQNSSIGEKLLTNQENASIHSVENQLKSQMNLRDFILKKNNQTKQFMVFTNDDQMFQIRRIALDSQGKLSVKNQIQIDEQSGKLSQSTVTALQYFQYQFQLQTKISSFLIMAMEAGDLCLYGLPNLQSNSSNSQHYLQPITKINIKKSLQFQPKGQDLDYSVTAIELIPQSMALVLVRKCGILIMDLKNFAILKHLSFATAPSKNYFFTDIRLISSIHSRLSTDGPQGEKGQNLRKSKFEVSFILASNNSLKKLFIQLTVDKLLDPSQEKDTKQFRIIQKVQKIKTKCNLIEQVNTPLIENLFPVVINSDHDIQVFGNYQADHIFCFTP